ncbi:hypothetical protein H0E87_020947 [Populus deltoides]|uniref:Transmembrane protein n=1 Tax=Populus deltoides TaxID=3696 RepID=A0A8T2XNH3_POPDE|nr:hypothetical protein H0E87_020947 [Populus deltoides]
MKEDPAYCCHVAAAVCRFGRKDPCYCATLAYCCSSSRSQVDESLPLAWRKIGALGVLVFCSFFTVFRPPLLFLHLLRNELLRGAAVRVFWFTSKGKGNERSGDGKGGFGREREILMRARHGAVSGAVGWRRGVCGGCLMDERESNG